MRRAAPALIFAAALGTAFVWSARAQTGAAAPAFDAASLKVNTGDYMGWSTSGGPGQRMLNHMPLKECLKLAFDLKDYSLDGPAWLDTVRLDIVAKPPVGSAPNQFNVMLQALLAERFKMAYHRQTRMLNGYALVQAPGGIKVRAVENPEGAGSKGSFGSSPGLLWGNGGTTAQLANMLARELNFPVQDLTASAEVFDFRLTWAQEGTPAITAAASEPVATDPGPSLSSALKEQLGLKLEKRKTPVSVLVIDKIERTPLEN